MSEFVTLFNEWRKARPEYGEDFVDDGIIDEDLYHASNKRVLIVLKETNGCPKDLRSCIREYWQGPKYTVWHNISRWIYGIQHTTKNSIPGRTEAERYKTEALLSSAVMNVKKKAGGAYSDMDEVKDYAIMDAEFIYREIELINPEVIIFGNTFPILREVYSLNSLKLLEAADLDGYVYLWNNRICIDFGHPAAQYPTDMMYYTLCSLYQQTL